MRPRMKLSEDLSDEDDRQESLSAGKLQPRQHSHCSTSERNCGSKIHIPVNWGPQSGMGLGEERYKRWRQNPRLPGRSNRWMCIDVYHPTAFPGA